MSASIGHARAMARNLIKKYKITKPPVDIRAIIKAEQFSLEFVDYRSGTSGESWWEHGVGHIRVNRNHSTRRKRFTMGHELGHLVLKHADHQFRNFTLPRAAVRPVDQDDQAEGEDQSGGEQERAEERLALNSTDPNETEANQFAAEILMPWSMFKKNLDSGMDVPALALRYHVSEEAAGWRAHTILVGR